MPATLWSTKLQRNETDTSGKLQNLLDLHTTHSDPEKDSPFG